MAPVLVLKDVSKSFVMHLRGGIGIPVISSVSLSVYPGECVTLDGPSGIGKSSILKIIFGNYAADSGSVILADNGCNVDIAKADARTVLRLRRQTLGYVSQFFRAVPRVSAREVVADPLIAIGTPRDDAVVQAEFMLGKLNIPKRLWDLPPATFSGGEQQRVNVARGFSRP